MKEIGRFAGVKKGLLVIGYSLLVATLNLFQGLSFAQPNLDSLRAVWNDPTQPDTNRLKAMHDIAWNGYLFTQSDSAFYFARLEYEFAKEKGLKKQMANALHTQGASFGMRSDYDQAIGYYNKSLKIREAIGDKEGVASSLNNIGSIYENQGDYAKAIGYCNKSLKIREEIGDKKGMASSLNTIGNIYYKQGNYDKAINSHVNSLKIREEIGDEKSIAGSLINIGIIYFKQGDYDQAIRYYSKGLKICEEIEEKHYMANALGNIGIIYRKQGYHDKAIRYYSKGLNIYEEMGDKKGMVASLSNIGNIYKGQGDSAYRSGNMTLAAIKYDKAIGYYHKSLKIAEEINDKRGIAISLNNIGRIYHEQSNYTKAIGYYNKSLNIREEIGDKPGMASSLTNIGDILKDQGNYTKAIEFSSKALSIAQEVGVAIQTRYAAQVLYKSYKASGNHHKALEMYELYITTRDSIESEENQKEVIRQEFKYNYEKQALADSLEFAKEQEVKDLEISEQQAQLKQEATTRYALMGGGALFLVLALVAFRSYRLKRKDNLLIAEQKQEVEHQKELVEEKNQEITDSITYAQRIQEAILPPDRIVKEYLKESFVYYKPKDIVAGDFYWMEQAAPPPQSPSPKGEGEVSPLRGDQGGLVLFAAADCTGHGVPGAMVSVVCHNALNRAVREFNLTEPGKILDKVRELVIETFHAYRQAGEKSDHEVKDGMDIALCRLDTGSLILDYAGANNPLYVIRQNPPQSPFEKGEAEQSEAGGLIEIKPDKQPIGKYTEAKPFTTHQLQLNEGDSFYIFTDGFADQFGGPKGKKFKYKPFKQLLLQMKDKEMAAQRQIIDRTFEEWCGDLEQVDDVCVIGVRV